MIRKSMLTDSYKSYSIILDKFVIANKFEFYNVNVHYNLYGDIGNGKKLALFFHGFSTDTDLHIWWKKFPIKKLLKDYNIICFNTLGSCHGSFGPETINPNTGLSYANNFPAISIRDTVNFVIQALDKLSIQKLDLVFGCSMGGMQALDMYVRYSKMANKFISVCGSPLPLMTKLSNTAQINIISKGIEKDYSESKLRTCMGLAYFFFRLSCTSENALSILNNIQSNFSLENYFLSDSREYENQFSPYSHNIFLRMMTNFELNLSHEIHEKNNELVLISIEGDQFTPPKCINNIYNLLKELNCNVKNKQFYTNYGHEAWILDGKRFYEFIEKDVIYKPNTIKSEKFCANLCE